MKSSREHKRCGTSFLLFVMIVSIIFFLFIRVSSPVLRVVIRLLLMPVIAGVSYEIIRLAGKSDNKIVALLSKPGLMLQHLTTREPEPEMAEVAIAAVEAVFDWRTFRNNTEKSHEYVETIAFMGKRNIGESRSTGQRTGCMDVDGRSLRNRKKLLFSSWN